jgi:hypothetical protein
MYTMVVRQLSLINVHRWTHILSSIGFCWSRGAPLIVNYNPLNRVCGTPVSGPRYNRRPDQAPLRGSPLVPQPAGTWGHGHTRLMAAVHRYTRRLDTQRPRAIAMRGGRRKWARGGVLSSIWYFDILVPSPRPTKFSNMKILLVVVPYHNIAPYSACFAVCILCYGHERSIALWGSLVPPYTLVVL